jgi:hypothetical protein
MNAILGPGMDGEGQCRGAIGSIGDADEEGCVLLVEEELFP